MGLFDDNWKNVLAGVRHFEAGGKPYAPKWDYKLETWGFGTPTSRLKPGQELTPDLADNEMQSHLDSKRQAILKAYPHLGEPENATRLMALTDLTYNAGLGSWKDKGLGQAVARSDWQDAHDRFLQYTKAGGKDLPGLVKRRKWAAPMLLGQPPADPTGGGGAATTVRAGGGGSYLDGSRPMAYRDEELNRAGVVREEIDGQVERDPVTGEILGFRPPPGREDDLRAIQTYVNASKAALPQPRERSWQEFAGEALVGLGGVVGAAQGQPGLHRLGMGILGNKARSRQVESRSLAEQMAQLDQSGRKAALQQVLSANANSRSQAQARRARQEAAKLLRGGDREGARRVLTEAGDADAAAKIPASPTATGAAPQAQAAGAPPLQQPQDIPIPDDVTQAQAEVERLRAAANVYGLDEDARKQLGEQADMLHDSRVKPYLVEANKQRAKALFEKAGKRKPLPEAQQNVETRVSAIDERLRMIDQLLERDEAGNATGLSEGAAANYGAGSMVWNRPGSEASDAESNIKRLASMFSIDALEQIKKASGGIGTITESEWPRLASMFESIGEFGMSDEKALGELLRARQRLSRARQNEIEMFEQTYGQRLSGGAGGRTSARVGEDVGLPNSMPSQALQRAQAMPVGARVTAKDGNTYERQPDGTFALVEDEGLSDARPGGDIRLTP